VPTTPVNLTATYKTAAAWSPLVVTNFNPQTQTANGQTNTLSTTLDYFIPASPQGVVFLLHDTGDTGASWFSHPETLLLARDLVAAGYGVAALDSVNRNTGAWNAQTTLAGNPDALNVAAALDKFARDNVLAATKPVFLLGFANGGDAAARFAEMLATATPARPVKGAIAYDTAGSQTLAATSHVPQFFALSTNDAATGATGSADARDNSALLAGRGVATALLSNGASPVVESRIRMIGVSTPAFAAADAAAVLAALRGPLLDANGYPKAVPTLPAVAAALPAAYQARAADVLAELNVAYAAQEMYSDADARVIAFLNNRVADAAAPAPGRLVNLSTRTKIGAVGDSLALGFAISGPQKATLLIRGVGPALLKFGLPGALAAPHLEVNRGSTVIARNDAWEQQAAGTTASQIAAAAAAVGAFALAPGDADTAVLLTLDPDTYTVNITGLNGATGDVLAEVYDVSKNATRLTNLSCLGKIRSEGDVLIPGIVIEGNTTPRTLLMRAVGPGLADFQLPPDALLGDPRLVVVSSDNQTIASNNNWAQAGDLASAQTLNAVFPAVGAFPLKATNSDAALVFAFAPGGYNLQTSAAPVPTQGPGGTTVIAPQQTGLVLVEVYEVP